MKQHRIRTFLGRFDGKQRYYVQRRFLLFFWIDWHFCLTLEEAKLCIELAKSPIVEN